jgi:hypothetical protein
MLSGFPAGSFQMLSGLPAGSFVVFADEQLCSAAPLPIHVRNHTSSNSHSFHSRLPVHIRISSNSQFNPSTNDKFWLLGDLVQIENDDFKQ